MIKAVIFDAGGVLHPSSTAVSDDLKLELKMTDDQLRVLWSKYIPRLLVNQISESEIWTGLREEFGIRKVDTSERLLVRAFEANLQKSEDVYKIVGELKQRGLKVMLLTNVSEMFAEVLERTGHYRPFEYKLLSYQVGVKKPDSSIFQMAISRLAVAAGEIVFIDDQESNVEAADKLGMNGLVFQDADQLQKDLAKLSVI